MESILLKSDEEYFQYCFTHNIGNIHRKYTSQWFDIDGECEKSPCDFWEKYENGESLNIKEKPVKYPCIFVWHCEEGDHDRYYGHLIYEDDFNVMKNTDDTE